MATKKKTKVGSFLSKVGTTIKNVVGGLSSAVSKASKTSQTASVYNAIKQPTILSTMSASRSTPTTVDTKGTQYVRAPVDTKGTQYVKNPTPIVGPYSPTTQQTKTSSSSKTSGTTGTTYNPYFDPANFASSINTLSSNFSGVTPPSSTGGVTSFGGTGSVKIPDLPYETPDITKAKSELEASKTYNDAMLKDEQQSEQDMLAQENKGILANLLKRQEPVEDVKRDYEKYYQVQAQQAKVESLTKDYNALVASRDQQISDILGSPYGVMDFTNNRIAQIERNAAPRINQMSADIKFETALLTQKQELVQQAVNDFFKEEDRQLNMYQLYMEQNSDIIDRLDKKQQLAIQQAFELKKMQLDESKDMRMMAAEYAYKYPQAGINWQTDSPEQIQKKLASLPQEVTSGLTPAQINATVNQIASSFDNEQIVKNYNTAQEGYQTIKSIGPNTKSPADDIAFIYAFAKIMDPNSVVREGEYNTIQKYAQNWAQNFGFQAQRIFSNTNFLSPDAKQKMLNSLTPKINTITKQYQNVASEYQRQIDAAYTGQPRQITDYSRAFTQATQEQTKEDIFNSVISQDSGGYLKNIWNAIIGK